VARLEATLGSLFDEGLLIDAVIAQSEAQRRTMWERREAAAEITRGLRPMVDTDIAVPLDKVSVFLSRIETRLQAMDPGARAMIVAHLGDGNVHYTALPTPWMVGVTEKEGKDNGVIGPNAYWVAGSSDAKFGFLEFEGKGLDSYVNEIDRLETQMGNFGAKLLKESKRAAEAAETAAINRAGETSLLASWSATVGDSIRVALEIARDWAGITGDITVKLNTDYMPLAMDPAMLRELTSAVVSGQISYDTYWMNLVRGELASEDRTWVSGQLSPTQRTKGSDCLMHSAPEGPSRM
jgi:hypothetical protein